MKRDLVNTACAVGATVFVVTLFYERDTSFFDNGQDNAYWVQRPGAPLTPQTNVGLSEEFVTELLDVTRGTQSVQLGGLAAFGVQSEFSQAEIDDVVTNAVEMFLARYGT